MKGTKAKVEQKQVAEKKAAKRKPANEAQAKRQMKKEKKAKKDPNKPKRPPSAFFVFLDEFRKEYKKANPTANSVSAVGKAGGERRTMSDGDKAPFVAKAEKKKAEYEKSLSSYNKQQDASPEEVAEESDKSKSEINDEEDDESGEEEDDE